MAEKIIKTFTIGTDTCKVDYVDGLVNKPTIPADKSAEIEALQAQVTALEADKVLKDRIIKKLQKTDDRIADIAYAEFPKLIWTCSENILELYVVRGNSGYISNPIWTKNNTTYSYHKNGQGYEEAGDDAQFNLVAVIPEGKAIVHEETYTQETKPFNQIKVSAYINELGEEIPNTFRVGATRVSGSFNISLNALASYNISYVPGTYIFSPDAEDVPAVIAEGNDLIFKFMQSPDGQDLPSAPTAAEALAKIDSIKVNNIAIELSESLISKSGKGKCTVKIPSAQINGSVVITLK